MSLPDNKKFGIDYLGLIGNNPLVIGLVAEAFIVTADFKFMSEAKGKENLYDVVSYVNRGEGGAVLTPNHLSMYDLGLFYAIRKLINPNIPFAVPWANKFTGIDSGIYEKESESEDKENEVYGKIGTASAKRRHIELFSVPQESSNENSREAVKVLSRIRTNYLENNGVAGIFIEGTRSRDGNLKIAKQGINRFFGSEYTRKHTIISPIAILDTDKVLPVDSKSVHITQKVETIFGKPYKYNQAKDEMEYYGLSLAEVIMLHIAELLPCDKWGVYSEKFNKII